MIVLWMVMILSLLVMGIALTMQLETKLASLNRMGFKCDALARAGIELAREQLMMDLDPAHGSNVDSFKSAWSTNTALLQNHQLGEGVVNVKITPEDGKLNINTLSATPEAARYLFQLLQVQPADIDVLVDSIQDWIDTDDNPRVNGAESEYYSRLTPPYRPKNGPIDRLGELLLVRGMTPDLYYGSTSGHPLRELLTALSSGKVNVNVAPPLVLAVLLGIDESQAEQIVNYRNGDDGIPGTEDDRVFYSRQDLPLGSASILPQELAVLQNVLDFKSHFFTIVSEGRIGGVSRTIRVTVSRDENGIKTLAWQEGADALR